MTEKQFNKLPKWAKEELNRRGCKIKRLESEIERLDLSNVGTGRIILDPYSDNPKHLGELSTISINGIHVLIGQRGKLHVSCLSESAIIRPIASNCFDVEKG